MIRRLLLTLCAALLGVYHVTARAQAPEYVYCINATSTQCNTTSNPGNGTQGDDSWLAFGKLNLDLLALQPPTPQYSVVYANGSSYSGLLPGATGTWCLQWNNLTSAPSLTACPGAGALSFALVSSGTNTATLHIGTGGSLNATGSGVLAATTAAALAATPTQCSGGTPLATGVAANGNANCTGAGSNAWSAVTAGTNAQALVIGTGGSLSTSGTGAIVATSTVAGAVTLAMMANETADTLLCNNTGSAAAPIACTVAQVLTLLTSTSGGGTTNYLRADGTWAAPPGGGGSPAFSAVTAGINANALVMGTGGSLSVSGTGSIAATTAAALAATPTQCSGGTPLATGVAANGNANCTAAGAQTIAAGATALPTAAVSANSCSASATTATATGVATTDAMEVAYASDPTGVTGYGGGTNGGITIRPWLTTNTFNVKLCNETASSITPGALSVNWRVAR